MSNQATDHLCSCPYIDKANNKVTSSEEYEIVTYAVVCDALTEVVKSIRLPLDVKHKSNEGA